MAVKIYKGRIPFNSDGTLICYPVFREGEISDPIKPYYNYTWRDNFTFNAEMFIGDGYKGRSAAGVYLSDDINIPNKYYTSLDSFVWLAKNCTIFNAKISVTNYTFVKRGPNYLMEPVK